MADNKYGRVFTEGDLEKILDYVAEANAIDIDLAVLIKDMDEDEVRFKFEPDEPLFILRGHDQRAIAAIRYYQDHQSPRAPANHLDAIASAVRAFDAYRERFPKKLREPD